jgi:hypothetical protein
LGDVYKDNVKIIEKTKNVFNFWSNDKNESEEAVFDMIDKGTMIKKKFKGYVVTTNSVVYNRKFSISQSWRCSPRHVAIDNNNANVRKNNRTRTRTSQWVDCDKTKVYICMYRYNVYVCTYM